MLRLWGMRSTSSLPWPLPLWPGMVEPDRALLLCFDLLTRPKMPFKVVHRKEGTYSGRWKSEEVAKALRRVYITAWEFEGNIRPTN